MVPRGLIREVLRDPGHLGERVVLTAVTQLREEALRFAVTAREKRPGATTDELCAAERRRVLTISRVDGLIAGTPFLIALVPAYVAFLWEQVRMTLRFAALNGSDLPTAEIAAEILWLRGVHPTVERARGAIAELDMSRDRRFDGFSARGVYDFGRRLLVLIGIIGEPRDHENVPKWRRNLVLFFVFTFGAATWILTWFFPVTLMVLIAYSCDGSTRQLSARAAEHFGTGTLELHTTTRWYRPRLMAVLLGFTIAIPIGLLVIAVHEGDQFVGTRRLFVGLLGLALALAMSGWLRLRVPRRRGARQGA